MYPYPNFFKIQKDNSGVRAGINTGFAATIMMVVFSNALALVLGAVFTFIAARIFKSGTMSGVTADSLKTALTYIFSTDNIYGLIINMLLYVFGMFLPFLIIAIYRKDRVKELVSFKKPKASHLAYGIFITLGVSVVAQIVVSIILNILNSLGLAPGFPNVSMNASSPVATALYFFFISIMPAFFEEFAMRGVVLGGLKTYSKYFALFFSALLFSLMHGTIQQIPYAFILGLCIAYFVIKFDSIWIGIAIHFANNFISCVFELLSKHYGDNIINTLNNMLSGIMLIMGVLFLVIFAMKHSFSLNTEGESHTFKECLSVMVRRPMLYITIVVFAIVTVINGYMT